MTKKNSSKKKQQKRHKFFLNPYIAKKQEIEAYMAMTLSPELSNNDYLVMGTVDRKDWREGNKGALEQHEIIKRMYVFKDIWDFEVIPAGWYPSED